MSQREKEHHYTVITEDDLNEALRVHKKMMTIQNLEKERAEADEWAKANNIKPIIPHKFSWSGLILKVGLQIATLVLIVLTGVHYMRGVEVHSAPVGIFEYVTLQGDDMLVVTVGENIVPADWTGVYVPTMIWEGFELTEEKVERLGHKLRYDNLETGEYIVFLQYSQNMTINMYTEGKIEYVMIQDQYMANVYIQNNTVNINWKVDDVTILISGNVTKDRLIEFANHIQWRE